MRLREESWTATVKWWLEKAWLWPKERFTEDVEYDEGELSRLFNIGVTPKEAATYMGIEDCLGADVTAPKNRLKVTMSKEGVTNDTH